MFEPRRCPLFELSDGLRPARDEGWVDPAGTRAWQFEVSTDGASRVLSRLRGLN